MKAIIFDLDNTLMDFMRMKDAACDEAMTAMIDAGLDIKKNEGLKILYEIYDKHGIEYKEIFQKFLKKTIKKVDWKILASGIVAYRRVKLGYLATYPHTHSTLIALKQRGIKLAIISDAPRPRAWLRLAALKLGDFFDVVITHDDTGKYKPHKQPFVVAMKRLGVKPEDCLMVGDWPERDIAGAKNLGMRTCLAKYGLTKKHKKQKLRIKADYSLNSIKDLLKIIQ